MLSTSTKKKTSIDSSSEWDINRPPLYQLIYGWHHSDHTNNTLEVFKF